MSRSPKYGATAASVAGACFGLAATLAGCGGPPEAAPPPLQSVTVHGDSLCLTRKPTWSVFDTPETIAQQVAAAELWDKRCARRGKPK